MTHGHLMSRNNPHVETRESYSNIACSRAPNGGIAEENVIFKMILGRDLEMTNVMKFLKKVYMFEKI